MNNNSVPVVSVKSLSKKYGDFEAVKNLSFEIYPGETFGLIGPDGAGKTTTFHILGGVLEKTAGEVLVLQTRPRDARLQTGYLTQVFSLYLDLSIDENMRYMAGLREVPQEDFERRRKQYLKQMDLARFSDRLAGQLSGGMKQKLALCCALIARPKFLLLDEPTTGVDPVSRREFWDLLATVTREGVTVMVATPYLDEAERCSRLILLHEGEMQDIGTPTELKQSLHLHRLEVRANKLQLLQNSLQNFSATENTEQSSKDRRGGLVPPAGTDDRRSEKTVGADSVPPAGPENRDSQNTDSQNTGSSLHSSPLQTLRSGIDSTGLDAALDIQPYGDRLDILTANVEGTRKAITDIAQKEHIENLRIDLEEPTLENVFVSKLRSKSKAERGLKFPFVRENKHSANETAIEAQKINKVFGHFQAVHDVSLSVKYGQIYGLLGANGAGKTTTIKMLCGLLTPTSGQMSLAGEVGNLRSEALRRELGYMSQKFTLYDDLTILENLEFYCGVYCVADNLRKERIRWVLRNSGLLGQENLITGKLPGGWKQRLAFGAAVMHEPTVLFLDEPTSGVDPLARREMWGLIRQLAEHGTAVLVTTHFLEEAENCNQMCFMAAGEVVAEGSPSSIKADQPGQLFEIRFANAQAAYDFLKQKVEPWRVTIFADSIHLVLDTPEKELPDLQSACKQNGLDIINLRTIPFSLEDAFISIVQRAARNNSQGQAA